MTEENIIFDFSNVLWKVPIYVSFTVFFYWSMITEHVWYLFYNLVTLADQGSKKAAKYLA